MRYTIAALLIAIIMLQGVHSSAQCTISVSIVQFPDTICEGASFTLSANTGTAGVNFQWSGPGNYSNTGQNITIPISTKSHAGTYKVVATKTGCTSDSDTVAITVHYKPDIPGIQTNGIICIGDTMKLTLKPYPSRVGQTFMWWGPAGFSETDTFAFIPNASKANAGNYFSLATDTFGCVSDTGKYVRAPETINTRPATPVASGINQICKGDTLKITGPAILTGQKYHWNGPASLTFSTKDISLANYTLTGINSFILTVDSMGCYSEPDTVDINVLPTSAPKVTISANPGFIVGPNADVTLTANPVDTGLNIQYQWKINSNDVNGATNKTFKVTTLVDVTHGDAISVGITTGPTCNSTKTVVSAPVVINIDLGVDDVNTDDEVAIYPNPAGNVIHIDLKTEELINAIICNTTGQVMVNTNLSEKETVNISKLTPGAYYIRLIGSSLNKTYQFIKR
ncbi:MAG: T9SS type A sorting domain-containing protein [Chitinophagaceae bacterium]|nr:T9SS type A sorting domain-containing protein [Chitinophagaceae bacterium]MCB9046274.1 T9SS type A sorting domain-containing protein [Chitinophagales bacterium]